MKFLKLKFEHARLMVEKNQRNKLGTNRFFHPINKLHVYNSLCVLFDRTPTPQLREVDNTFMPFYDDMLSVVEKGYIKINSISELETNTIIKKPANSNAPSSAQYSWKDCRYVTGNLFPIFLHYVSKTLNISEETLYKKAFDDVISKIQSMGVRDSKGEIVYDIDNINDLISWCKANSSTQLANYIKSKKNEKDISRGFGKRVHRGSIQSRKYNGLIYIPLNNELFTELINHTKGFATILDGGLVTILGYEELIEDDINGFIEINSLNEVRKFDKPISGQVSWDNTIYKHLDENNLEKSMKVIIKKCDVSIKDNQKEYDSMMEKVNKLKKLEEVTNKLNHFIESSINKQY